MSCCLVLLHDTILPGMFSLSVLMRFFDRVFIVRLIMIILLVSLLPLADVFFFLYLGGLYGRYILVAVAASTGLLAIFLVLRGFTTITSSLKTKIREGVFPEEDFASLAGLFLAGVLLLTPGFLSDFLGIIFFLPSIRCKAGKIIVRPMRERLKEVYEYLKMYL